MSINVEEANELCMMRYEPDNETYTSYMASTALLVRDRMLEEMFMKHNKELLTEDEVLEYISNCDLDNLRCFVKIYEYEESFDKIRVMRLLKARYKAQRDICSRNLVFQCIRRLSKFVDFDFLKDLCDDQYLGLVVGEYARRNNFDVSFFDGITSSISSVFLTYTHMNALVLDSFDPAFNKLIETKLEILDVLDYGNKRVEEIVVGNVDRDGVVEYILDHNLGSDEFLDRIVNRTKNFSIELFLKESCFRRLTEDSIVKYLSSLEPALLVNIGLSGHRDIRLYKILAKVIKDRMLEVVDVKGLLDVLILIVHYVPEAEFGSSLRHLSLSSERDLLIEREEGVMERHCVFLDCDGDMKSAKEQKKTFFECDGFTFDKKKGTETVVQEYLDKLSQPEPSNTVELARRRLGFRHFLTHPHIANFGQILGLQKFYFTKVLESYSNSFLALVLQFDRIALGSDRRKFLIAKNIVSMGYKDLFVRYLVERNKYFRIELNFSYWSKMMSLEYKSNYLRDFPNVLVERQSEIFEEFKNCMHLLLPVIEVLRSSNPEQATVACFGKHTVGMFSEPGCSTASNELVLNESGFHTACVSDRAHEVDVADKCPRSGCAGKSDSYESVRDKYVPTACLDTKKSVNTNINYEPMRIKPADSLASELGDLYEADVSLESVNHNRFREKSRHICNEICKRMSEKDKLKRVAYTTSVLVRDDGMFHGMLSMLYRRQQFGRDFTNLMRFVIFFLSYCRMELRLSSTLVKMLRRYVMEDGSMDFLYFVFMKIRIEDIEVLFSEFKDKGAGTAVISKSVCDRISALGNAGEIQDTIRIEVKTRQHDRKRKGEVVYNIDEVEMWPFGDEKERFSKALTSLLDSEDEDKNYLGLRGVIALGRFDIDVGRFLDSRNDGVLQESLRIVQKGSVTTSTNNKLMEILYRRGRLDDLGRMCLKTINIDIMEKDDVDRVYDMFFIDPINYLEILPSVLDRGYEISSEVSLELIRQLRFIHSDRVIDDMVMVLRSVEYTDEMVFESILSLETAKLRSKLFLLEKICNSTARLNIQMFLKLCVYVGNEDNYQVLEGLLRVVKNNWSDAEMVEKWKGNRALNRLMVRMYPLYMKDKIYYKNLLHEIRQADADEWAFVRKFHKNKLEGMFVENEMVE